MQNSIKVEIKLGCGDEFELFCKTNDIKYKRYPEPLISKYKVFAVPSMLRKKKSIIENIKKMPEVKLG